MNSLTTTALTNALMAFVNDAQTAEVIEDVIKQQNPGLTVQSVLGGVTAAEETLKSMPTPAMLVIDLSDAAQPETALNDVADHCEPGTQVIALGPWNDVGLYRRLVSLGVEDYLPLPLDAEAFAEALKNSEERKEQQQHSLMAGQPAEAPAAPQGTKNKTILVVGAQGGAGAATVAAALAYEISQTLAEGEKAAVIDLDLHFGGIALNLDADVGHGLCEVLAAPERLDDLFLQRAMVPISDHLYLMGSQEPLDSHSQVQSEALEALMEQLNDRYHYTVIDCPRQMLRDQPQLLEMADTVMVVTTQTLKGLRDALRLRDLVKNKDVTAEFRLVINKQQDNKKAEITQKDFENSAGFAPYAALPFDEKAVRLAVANAQPLTVAAPKSPLAEGLRKLTRLTFDLEVAKPTFWQKLLGQKSSTE